ncbi:RIP metalloprotease RseP [soil metagenome]
MDALVMAAQLILGLSLLVGLHELGHLLAAKAFGMKVEQFSIGFPPKIFGVKYGETEYSVGAIPLGGFVKITGMVDESLDTKHLNEEPKPYEFRAKPAWQRLIVMMGGIILNVILGILIFIGIAYYYGESYIPQEQVNQHGIVAYELGQELGFQTGDKILKINGQEFERFNDVLSPEVMMGSESYYTVERNGQILDLRVPRNFLERLNEKEAVGRVISPGIPSVVGSVEPGMGADRAGLQADDRIIRIDGQEVSYHQEVQEIVRNNQGTTLTVQVERNGQILNLQVEVSEEGLMGYSVKPLYNVAYNRYSFGASIVKGTEEAFASTWLNIRGVGKIFTGELSTRSIKGPIGIATIYSGTWDWYRFWLITGVLSMWLAFVNFLPIPALDGGHVAFLSYEIVSGRKPSDRFLENAQKVGMVLLLTLMVFVIFNDVFNAFF